jgi:hypothetical protein
LTRIPGGLAGSVSIWRCVGIEDKVELTGADNIEGRRIGVSAAERPDLNRSIAGAWAPGATQRAVF